MLTKQHDWPHAAVRTVTIVFLVGTVLAGTWIAILAYGASQLGPVAKGAFVTDYHGRVLDDGLELLIIQSDGQAYATLARDPFLRRGVESFRTEAEASYRAQRPLLGWLAWAGSLGRSGWVPPAMAAISAMGAGLAAAGSGALLRHRGRSPWFGLLVLLLPGTGSALSILGPEALVVGLALCGIAAWERDRPWLAVGLFTAAVLGKETSILIPFALGLVALRRDWRRAAPLLVVPSVLAGWFAVLRIHLGAWPWDAGEGRLGAPFEGLGGAVTEHWTPSASNPGALALGVLLGLGALLAARHDPLTVVVAVHVVFATLMGDSVWADVVHFSRVLLPLYALALIAIIGAIDLRPPGHASADRSSVGATAVG